MGEEEVFEDSEVGHGRIDHRGERDVTVLGDNDVTPPSMGLLECLALNVLDTLVHGEGHPISGYRRVENDVGIGKLLVHPVESLNKLLITREVYQTVGSKARRRSGLPGTSKRQPQSPRSTRERSQLRQITAREHDARSP